MSHDAVSGGELPAHRLDGRAPTGRPALARKPAPYRIDLPTDFLNRRFLWRLIALNCAPIADAPRRERERRSSTFFPPATTRCATWN
jgi:hypothetical protein